jgi:sec-independent protein translocase protein TatA
MHGPGLWGIIIVAIVVVVLFGRGKISGFMGEFASGIKAFQKGMADEPKSPPMTATVPPIQSPQPTPMQTPQPAPMGTENKDA